MPGRITQLYEQRIAMGEIEPDPAQADVVRRLDELATALEDRVSLPQLKLPFLRTSKPVPVRGLYIHGAVGRGKTMLMDLFYESIFVRSKRRVHFHAFMGDTHERIARARMAMDGDPIPQVAAGIARDAAVLCFDEFHVTDIADAMILGRLFKGLFERNTVIVATSNAAPDRLYWNGLNRQLFLPFIEDLQERLDIVELRSAKDFRLDKLAGHPLFFVPADASARAAMDAHWQRLTHNHQSQPCEIEVKGRKFRVPQAAMGVARFTFEDLCAQPVGAADYLQIAHAFHTVMIDGIPALTPDRRNEARRFITLIDTLYDEGVGLIASADAEPDRLYPTGDGAELFERTASRLMEMRSEAYLRGRHGAVAKG